MKYRVKNGSKSEFEVDDVKVVKAIEAGTRARESETRSQIAKAILLAAVLFLASAAAFGLSKNDFSALSSIWNAASPLVGVVLGYYFGKSAKG